MSGTANPSVPRSLPSLLCEWACVCVLLSGCAATANDPRPQAVEPPAAWRNAQAGGNGAAVVDAHWWRSFGSGELDALIEEAQSRNQDLATALARVDAARARARIAGAALAPDLSGRLDAAREARMGGRADVDGNTGFVGFAASYELDLWGRRGALHQEALKGLRASEFDRDAVRLGVTAEVASSWLQLHGLREREAIARDNVANAGRVLQLVEARSRAGAVTPLDLAQQRGLVAARQRELAALQRQANDAETALAQLLGAPAWPPALRADREEGIQGATPLASLKMPSIEAGIPALALTRRPDIARAEARLAAADANLQAARAALLPGVSLGATIGLQGQAPGRLIDNPLYSLAAGVVAPIFDGGRLRGERDLSEARRSELLAGYRAAILGALADAETALNAVAGTDAQASAQAEELLQARRAAALSESRYRAGAETLLVLLDAQRTLYAAQDLAVQLQQQRLQSRVALYRALGGGWRGDAAAPLAQGGA
ncbi:efflux transporter outer membrane subunit [Variovorax sp. 770b2]|uniref:efflux transporter outer membrane subunit n=1 Tax=Variovorax sp. 770b2 TaxID=1566271 RepID=UPI0008E2C4E5|nr:efflux transporter outer membrane subunit [Variovorax sp. 770b2]SFP16146.1 efflux transporter, outer membrane factor (OMF) lipoprotein, NodT family [Variovorax sp. 770b2]